MARQISKEKLGFYPTPQVVVDLIKSCLCRSSNGMIRVYDPCAGNGDAVSQIATHLHAESFGVELDKKRAEQLKKTIGKVIHGDALRVSIRGGSVSCLFLNPPYDFDESGRLEDKFLAHTAPAIQTGGILILVVSLRSLNRQLVRHLCAWFGEIEIRRFPKDEFEQFKQVVVFGKKRSSGVANEDLEIEFRKMGVGAREIDELAPACVTYAVPVSSLPEKFFHFRNLEMSDEEMLEELREDGFEKETFDIVVRRNGNVRIRPAAPLRKGHLAILVAAGMTDGLVEKDGKRLLIKGTVRKEKRKTVESDENTKIVTELDVLKIEIMGLNLETGELFSIQ